MGASRHILVVFYSRSETTAAFARQLAAELDADCERLHEADSRRRLGAAGFLRSLRDVLRKRAADLWPTVCAPLEYDLVVIGMPVWAGRASTPVASWLARHGQELRSTAFFCTMGGRGDRTAFRQMQTLALRQPIATCAISRNDIRHAMGPMKLSRFAQTIAEKLAAQPPHERGE